MPKPLSIPGLFPDSHDAGGRSFPLPPGVTGTATFGGDLDCYRYVLTREWSTTGLSALIVGMNPSCADPLLDDPTSQGITRKVRGWAWKGVPHAFGRFAIVNTFAYRCADQARLTEIADPIGTENDEHIRVQAARAHLIVFACGQPKVAALRSRGKVVASMLQAAGHDLHALRTAADGTPWHPLYLPDNTVPFLWRSGAGKGV